MHPFRIILQHFAGTNKAEYELIPFDGPSTNHPQRRYNSSLHILKRRCTFRNILIVIQTAILLTASLILLNGGIPPLYNDIREYERHLPQHNTTFSQNAHVKYLSFPGHKWGHGWNNVLQEYLMLSYLAYITGRSFVFEDYIWSHTPFPYTIHDFALRPARIPLNAFIAGPTAGGPITTNPPHTPRAVSYEFWQFACPKESRRVLRSTDSPPGLIGSELVHWWKDAISKEQTVCLEIDMREKPIFEFEFFGSHEVLDVWPSFSKTPVVTQFEWSPLVLSALQRNFDIIPDEISSIPHHHPHDHHHSPQPYQSSTSMPGPPPTHTFSGLLALHIRRGDFKRHCARLTEWNTIFLGFNSFEGLPDRWIPYNDSLPSDGLDKIQYYRKRCFPTQDEIVQRLHTLRAEHDSFVANHLTYNISSEEFTTPLPTHQLRRIFILTNAWPSWLNVLKRKLLEDGWEDVIFSNDLILDRQQEGVNVAVDMSIAEKAEVFVGNGFSSLTGNIVMLRTAQGLSPQTNRFL